MDNHIAGKIIRYGRHFNNIILDRINNHRNAIYGTGKWFN